MKTLAVVLLCGVFTGCEFPGANNDNYQLYLIDRGVGAYRLNKKTGEVYVLSLQTKIMTKFSEPFDHKKLEKTKKDIFDEIKEENKKEQEAP